MLLGPLLCGAIPLLANFEGKGGSRLNPLLLARELAHTHQGRLNATGNMSEENLWRAASVHVHTHYDQDMFVEPVPPSLPIPISGGGKTVIYFRRISTKVSPL